MFYRVSLSPGQTTLSSKGQGMARFLLGRTQIATLLRSVRLGYGPLLFPTLNWTSTGVLTQQGVSSTLTGNAACYDCGWRVMPAPTESRDRMGSWDVNLRVPCKNQFKSDQSCRHFVIMERYMTG